MIEPSLPPLTDPDPARSGGADAGPFCFVCLWATGPDVALDAVFRLLAMRRAPGGGWEGLDRLCDPFPASPDEVAPELAPELAPGGSTARMAREFGVTRADLRAAVPLEQARADLLAFAGDATLVAVDGDALRSWLEHWDAEHRGHGRATVVGLTELAALLFPGRASQRGETLVAELLPRRPGGPPAAVHPDALHAALVELVGSFLELDPRTVRVAAAGYARAQHALAAIDPDAARRLAAALALVDRPSAWTPGPRERGELFHREGLADGRLSTARALEVADDEDPLAELAPHAATLMEAWADAEPLPPTTRGAAPFHPDDAALLDDLFRVHLPAALTREHGGKPDDYYREAQHAVAHEVARTLGADELLLVHAPTGTGKTAAYLAPALLWARRHGVRVAVATYTRALQEQAMDREVPRVLAALVRAGVLHGSRVAVLKGRENYLCFRALRALSPADDDEAEGHLAWTALALFALTDRDGDLDRLSARPPVRLTHGDRYRELLQGLVQSARARPRCCTHAEDRATCCAELARRRAERSHVVITNQSFALARQELFAHVIFDECEHLHDVAHGAWSHVTSFRQARDALARLHRPGRGPSRAPLDRLARMLVPGTLAAEELGEARALWQRADGALAGLRAEVEAFERWREDAAREAGEAAAHRLFRAYVEDPAHRGLARARARATDSLARLEAGLARLAETLQPLALRGGARVRRTLDLGRADLAALGDALEAWIPLVDGPGETPGLRRETFYDVERDARGELVLAARVLLPNEYLGSSYYPELASAVFLSATTRLRGGFEAALGYLGLDRAREPADGEERPPRAVRTFSAPETFDYSRVLVGVTTDGPDPREKDAFLAYVSRFLDWLGERTRGRILALFTNLQDVGQVGAALTPAFRARRTPLWYQGMREAGKEELSELFRARVDSVLLGVDTFWYGADFPGETLEYLVLVRLPYGVPDRYHHAQCAELGEAEQRRRIYLPRALAKFRQGFGRLMRRTTDRGCVFVLDKRVRDPRHRAFLRELPLAGAYEGSGGARLVRGDTDRVAREALAHMGMLADLRRRGLSASFGALSPARELPEPPPRIDVAVDDLPF